MQTKLIVSKEDKEKIELLRKEVNKLDELSTFYLNGLLNNKEFAFGTFDNDNIIAGIYFHRFDTILYIDWLFVKEEYQNKGIGKSLINKILNSKEELEKLLGGKITKCNIESRGEKSNSIYTKMGFKGSSNSYNEDMLSKRFK